MARIAMSNSEDDIVAFLSGLAGFERPLTIGARLIARHDWGLDVGQEWPQPVEWPALLYTTGARRVGVLPSVENLGSEVKEVAISATPMACRAWRFESYPGWSTTGMST